MRHIRDIAIGINDQFERFDEEFGITLKKIGVGAAAGDCTGDTFEGAMAKIHNNLGEILSQHEADKARIAELKQWHIEISGWCGNCERPLVKCECAFETEPEVK